MRKDTQSSDLPVPELAGLKLYEADPQLVYKWPELWEAWMEAYPTYDVMTEVRKAHTWELANPGKRKKDRPRFLNNWLLRAFSKGTTPRANPERNTLLERLREASDAHGVVTSKSGQEWEVHRQGLLCTTPDDDGAIPGARLYSDMPPEELRLILEKVEYPIPADYKVEWTPKKDEEEDANWCLF